MERHIENLTMMHSAKSLRVLLLTTLVAMTLSACDLFEARDRSYDGPPVLEFAPLSQSADEGAGAIATNIQLIGPQRGDPLTVNYVVDDSSTAVEGTHYTLASTSATIEDSTSSAPVNITVLDNEEDDANSTYILYLSLQESQGVAPAENLKTYTLTISGVDE